MYKVNKNDVKFYNTSLNEKPNVVRFKDNVVELYENDVDIFIFAVVVH